MSSIFQQFVRELQAGKIEVIDLSHTLQPKTSVIKLPEPFAQSLPFSIEEISNFDERGPNWYWNNIHLGEHTGTHFDAPAHWITGKDYPDGATDTIPLARRARTFGWEAQHGQIPAGSWVLMRTGWQSRAFTNAFLGDSHWPGPHPDVPAFLASERDVIGFGTEPVGTDAGIAHSFSTPFPCHHHMHGSNRFGLSSLANMDKLPVTGALLITPPLKIINGSGSPCRVLALVER